eukprot:SM000023S07706  [mRNA]  locus=s23:1070850:1076326:- [translate_table: standard]
MDATALTMRSVMQGHTQTAVLLRPLVKAVSGPPQQVRLKVERLVAPDRTRDAAWQLGRYNSLLRLGRLEDCLLTLERMDTLGILHTDKIYHGRFFQECKKRRAVTEAFRFMELISKPTLSTYNMLLSVCAEAEDVDGASRAFSAAKRAGLRPDSILYTTLISTYARKGKSDLAFKAFHEMEAAKVEANLNTFSSLIDGCGRARQIAKAFGVFGILLGKGLKPDKAVYNALITACARSGAVERAFDTLADMKSADITPDKITLGALIDACAKAGQVERALDVYNMMRKKRMKGTPHVYTAAVHACSVKGTWTSALQVYEDMKEDAVKPDEVFFSAMIDVARSAGKIDEAFEVLSWMRESGVTTGSITYSALMGLCSNLRLPERALELYDMMKAANLQLSTSTYNALFQVLGESERHGVHLAVEVRKEMQERGVRPNQITYSILIGACEKCGDVSLAFQLYAAAQQECVLPNTSMCGSMIGLCYQQIKRGKPPPTFAFALTPFASDMSKKSPQQQWATCALHVYRQTLAGGVTPTGSLLSKILGCLRASDAPPPQCFLDEIHMYGEEGFNSFSHGQSRNTMDDLYDPVALALYEEAVRLKAVPHYTFSHGPVQVDMASLPPHAAEVCMLVLLKAMKSRHQRDERLHPMTILLRVEEQEVLTKSQGGIKHVKLASRTGQAIAALLRRMGIAYQGSESVGRLKLTASALSKWMKLSPATVNGVQALYPAHAPGPPFQQLAKGIVQQQRAIRMGPSRPASHLF